MQQYQKHNSVLCYFVYRWKWLFRTQ